MAVVTMKQLLESGVHFGHATRRWNPKMAPYIFTSRNGIHIIDLKLTKEKIEAAYAALVEIAGGDNTVLFVGTKKQAQDAVKEAAEKSEQFYVNQRWLGGTLTNFKTIRRRIKRLHDLYKMEAEGTFELLPKKEVLKLIHERDKLEKNLGGIKHMKKLPEALFIVDPNKEKNAILEARKLGIPVFGIVDTNCDPEDVDFIIPGNDDAIRAVNLISNIMANAVVEAKGGYVEKVEDDDMEQQNFKPQRPTSRKPQRKEREPRKETKPREEKPTPKVEAVKTPEVKEAPKAEVKATPKAKVKATPKVEVEETKTPSVDINNMTVAELKDFARDNDISGYSALKKADLINHIKENLK